MMKIDIKEKLNAKGMSRYELSKRVDVTYPTITAIYESKSKSINLDTLEKICLALECTPNDIMRSENDQMNRLLAYYDKLVNHSSKE